MTTNQPKPKTAKELYELWVKCTIPPGHGVPWFELTAHSRSSWSIFFHKMGLKEEEPKQKKLPAIGTFVWVEVPQKNIGPYLGRGLVVDDSSHDGRKSVFLQHEVEPAYDAGYGGKRFWVVAEEITRLRLIPLNVGSLKEWDLYEGRVCDEG
jgi:hypothetical protein